jgi:putative acetyltransferase
VTTPGAPAFSVRAASPADRAPLVALWERSARATHRFLADDDIEALRPLVASELASDDCAWWVVEHGGALAGFLATGPHSIEGLFIDPPFQRRGAGRVLVAHALARCGGAAVRVDVNEANPQALAFYRRLGFRLVGRSATDDAGRPFPILHLEHP